MTHDDSEARWKDSLAAAAARAYEAAHGSAIPESRQGFRLRMSWRQASAAALALSLIAGVGWWFARTDAVGGEPLALPSASASGVPGLSVGVVVIDVSGAVAAPGLAELPAGSRVADAIEVAGGATADAVLDDVNLARKVVDGEQIIVPRQGDTEQAGTGLVNLNSADAQQLEALPGVGPVLAQRIVTDREANGPFVTLTDLGRVSGVGDAIVDALQGVATV